MSNSTSLICEWEMQERSRENHPQAIPCPDPADPIVGHKTFRDGHHEPLRQSEAKALLESCEEEESRRKELMPDEQSAIRMMFAANQRLRDFGWNDAIYCPKDGSDFQALEFGSTGIHKCVYEGEWPNGSWWVLSDGDMSPSRPVMFRKLQDRAPADESAAMDAESGAGSMLGIPLDLLTDACERQRAMSEGGRIRPLGDPGPDDGGAS